jgi:signal transduction histidine kinase
MSLTDALVEIAYITKEIIISHGGAIDVTSSKEDGTTFRCA